MDIRPGKHGKLTYLIHAHKPLEAWSLSVGTIDEVRIKQHAILIDFSITRTEAEADPSWDPATERVMLEVRAKDGRTVFEHPLNVDKQSLTPTLGLRE